MDEFWGRADGVIWLPQREGGLLLLADGADLPIHLEPAGLAVWGALTRPRRLTDLAADLDVDDSPGVTDGLRDLLTSLESFGVCRRYPSAEAEDPAAQALE